MHTATLLQFVPYALRLNIMVTKAKQASRDQKWYGLQAWGSRLVSRVWQGLGGLGSPNILLLSPQWVACSLMGEGQYHLTEDEATISCLQKLCQEGSCAGQAFAWVPGTTSKCGKSYKQEEAGELHSGFDLQMAADVLFLCSVLLT